MSAPGWLPAGLRNDHAGPLNARVHRILSGIYSADDGLAALIELFRSEEEIDCHVRAALADAFEAEAENRTSAFRLRLRKPDRRPRTWSGTMEQVEAMQAIASRMKELIDSGRSRQQAIGDIEDAGIAKRTKIEEALAFVEKAQARGITIQRLPKKPEPSSD